MFESDSNFISFSTPNGELKWETYAFNKSIDGSLPIIISKWGEIWISIWFRWWFVVDLLTQHIFVMQL